MTKKRLLPVLILSLCCIIMANPDDAKQQVKETIQKAIDAMYNLGDIERIRKHYHPGYILQIMNQNYLSVIPLHNRIEKKRQDHQKGVYPTKDKISIKFISINVQGHAAIVYFDYFKGKQKTCADFMSLYRFKEGWRIVNQTSYHYPEIK